jgi:hypothetical protein
VHTSMDRSGDYNISDVLDCGSCWDHTTFKAQILGSNVFTGSNGQIKRQSVGMDEGLRC